jgi:menaquinone-dependent protoporphyrinogen oxidase
MKKHALIKSTIIAAVVAILLGLPSMGSAYMERPEDIIETSCGPDNGTAQKILIAYDTKHGATATIAEKLSETLCQKGFRVDVRMARNVDDLSGYDAVIAGSPIYNFYWLPEAVFFLFKYKEELAERPLFPFIVCTYLKDENDTPERRAGAVDLYVNPLLGLLPGLEPADIGIISGEFSYDELYPFERFRMILAGFEEGDFRNWDKITAWAESIAEQLQ